VLLTCARTRIRPMLSLMFSCGRPQVSRGDERRQG